MVLAGDYNVIPTELDAAKPASWVKDALFLPETREAYRRLLAQGWTDALRAMHPGEKIYTFWDYFRQAFARNAGIRIDHLLLSPELAPRLKAAGVDRDVRALRRPATMHRPGSRSRADHARRGGGRRWTSGMGRCAKRCRR